MRCELVRGGHHRFRPCCCSAGRAKRSDCERRKRQPQARPRRKRKSILVLGGERQLIQIRRIQRPAELRAVRHREFRFSRRRRLRQQEHLSLAHEGTNLGLENRNLYAEFGKQGKYRFFAAMTELLANRSDTYQTPYLGVGTDNLTLPSNWMFPAVPQVSATIQNFRSSIRSPGAGSFYNSSGVLTAPTTAQLAAGAASVRRTCRISRMLISPPSAPRSKPG